ncbi:MAG: glycosyltransferase [Flavobacteriaceae bacterium]|nr:glycosyltransferase [Flavobacteriaceae bacterium]
MITIILTYRNRDITIVNRCLNSLQQQGCQDFKALFVDYGSDVEFSNATKSLLETYAFVSLIHCQTQGELWCKTRAINIALKQVKTPYVFIGDVDMIYHPDFIKHLDDLKQPNIATYFQVGFLSEAESKAVKAFDNYQINFTSNAEATGMTLMFTNDLLAINGFDEFYHGWGSEDTDVHVRLKANGVAVNYYDQEVLMLHQWHPKAYRSVTSTAPFHSSLEQINHAYLAFTKASKKTKVNLNFKFGDYNYGMYKALQTVDATYTLTNRVSDIKGFINNILLQTTNQTLKVTVSVDVNYKSFKEQLKGFLGKKTIPFLSMQAVNDLLLETLITYLRDCAYSYSFNQQDSIIVFTIRL